jgi:hypothetical protein
MNTLGGVLLRMLGFWPPHWLLMSAFALGTGTGAVLEGLRGDFWLVGLAGFGFLACSVEAYEDFFRRRKLHATRAYRREQARKARSRTKHR